MDWPRLVAVLHTTGLWGRSYLGVGRRAASRTWLKLCQREDTGLPWGKPYRGRIHIWDYPKGNQAIRTPSPVQGLTPPSLTVGGAWRILPGFTIRGIELVEKKALVSPGEGEWRSKRDTGQLFPPITCYPTHGKKLDRHRDCRILRRCSVSPSPQLCRWWEHWARIQARVSRQGESRPARTQGTLRLPKTPGGPRPVWWKWARSGALS